METKEKETLLQDVDICISTFENPDGLEKLLHSIADTIKGARIFLADSAKELDRAYYKKLRAELGDAGLINRLVIHHIAYKSGVAGARNFLMTATDSRFKVFFDDTQVLTKETDLESMAQVLDKHPSIGLVSGAVNVDGEIKVPSCDDVSLDLDGIKYSIGSECGPFIMVVRELKNYIRLDQNAADPILQFSNQMSKVPYQMAVVAHSVINQTNINAKTKTEPTNEGAQSEGSKPTGASNRSAAQSNVPSADGGK